MSSTAIASLLIDRVAALRLPAIYPWAEEAEEGGFLAYGPRLLQQIWPPMAEMGHERLGGASCRSSNVRNAPVSDGRLKKGGLS